MTSARTVFVVLLVAFASLAPVAPVALLGRPGTGHDLEFHCAHVRAFAESIEEGVIYPRWAASMNGGYGAPTFQFYPPLPWALAVAGGKVTGEIVSGFFLAAALLMLFGGVCMYRLLRRDTGVFGAIVGVALFGAMPYGILDLYHRFAWAEFCAIQWMPAIVLALRRQLERPGGVRCIALTGTLVGLIGTHLVTAITFGPLLVIWVGYGALRRRSWRPLAHCALPAVLAALTAAAFLLPIALERGLVHLDHITESRHGQYGRNFLYRDQTLLGFTRAPIKPIVEDAASAQLVLVVGAMIALALRRRLRGWIAFVVVVAFVHFFLTTPWSEPIWRLLPFLGTVQFPWRMLGALGFLAAWLIALACGGPRLPRIGGRVAVALAIGLPIALAAWVTVGEVHSSYTRPEPWMVDKRTKPIPDSVVIREYLPKSVQLGRLMNLVHFERDRRTVQVRGEAVFDWTVWEAHHRRARVRVGATGAKVLLPIFRYPGWTTRVDGREVSGEGSNALRLIEVALSPGEHELDVVNGGSPGRRIGTVVSVIGVLLLLLASRLRGRLTPPPRPFFTGRRRWIPLALGAGVLVAPIVSPEAQLEPHIVVITGSALRADHASFNGYVRPTTPSLTFLGGHEGVRVRRAYTPGPEPAAAAVTLFCDSGLAQRFRAEGYAVGAFVGEDMFSRRPELAAAFPDARLPAAGARMPASEVVSRAMRWIRQHGDRSIFIWLHFADPAGPWIVGEDGFVSPQGPTVDPATIPERLRVRDRGGRVVTDLAVYRDLYDDTIVKTDRAIGRFANDLYRLNQFDKAAIAVVGLSGIDLGDGPTPLVIGGSLHEAQTAVMLILKFPGGRHAGEGIARAPVSIRQVASTMVDLLPGESPVEDSLMRWIEDPERRATVEVRSPNGDAVERVFETFKVRWSRGAEPEVIRRAEVPPWESPWEGPLPAEANHAIANPPALTPGR